ncbi:MAG: LysR family transcriptional regulator [Dongiaceae bacterium]
MLSFAHLEALIAIAELGSFRAAAERLGVTQPTVSMRIRELEHSLGTQLFDRSTYRPRLTADGREILRYAQRMMGLLHEMRASALDGAGVVGTIRLGAADTFALTCLPALLGRLEDRFPRLKVALDIDYSFNLNRKLQAGELDLAFLTAPAAGPEVSVEPLAPIGLAWVASPRLGLPEGRLSPADLCDLPILTNPEPSNLYSTALAWFGGAGLEPARLSTCNSLTHMLRLAAAGVGVSLLPTAILRAEVEAGLLRVLETAPAIAPHEMALGLRCGPGAPDLSLVRSLAREVVARSELAAPA